MIRYPVTLKNLKKENQKSTEEEVIANEDGEVFGRKGNVAKLTQIFKIDEKPTMRRSSSVGRNSSRIPIKTSSIISNTNVVTLKSGIPKPDYKNVSNDENSFAEKQARVEDLLKLYDNNYLIHDNSDNFNSKHRNNISENNNEDTYKYRIQNHIPLVRELRKREEFKINRDRDGTSDLKYRQRFSDKRTSLLNNEIHYSQNEGVLSKSKWDDYEEKEIYTPVENPNNITLKIKDQTENVEEELIETWEEIHTVPYVAESEFNMSANSVNSNSDKDSKVEFTYKFPGHTNYNETNESAFPYNVNLKHIPNRNQETNPKKIMFNYHRKSLAEILSEYQRKGVVPQNEINTQDFPVKRGEIFIENNIDTTSAARTIDVVTQCAHNIENNANPYQSSFHVAKENPIYTNNYDWQDKIGKNRWRIN